MSRSYKISEWSDLSRDELYACVRLRIDVFVVEQDCSYPDLDGKDMNSLHVFADLTYEDLTVGASTDAYLRICKPGISYKEPSIGRVVTSKSVRGQGLGYEIMQKGIEVCSKKWPNTGIRISAQKYLVKFYENLDFKVCSEPYLEDDILHVQMFRS
ncbi:MAG: GNAT family N-acetyltransferase [Crocinitomicaceae bacterium]|nr:GNAT family N-acetyltransferase [Crocinitomicaceae bacterium]|tara:strand:- start:7433 stop:7900 length:468 start_codon:yes stop_codon:yes gene_type:complete